MYARIFAFLLAVFILAGSCTSSKSAQSASPQASASAASVATVAPKPIYKLALVTTTYPDGMTSGVVSYTYDAAGRLVKEEQKQGNGTVNYSKVFSYKPDGSYEYVTNDNLGELKSKTIVELQNNNMVRETALNGKNEVQSISEFSYDKLGRKVFWLVKGQAIGQTNTEYIYAEDKNKTILVKDAANALVRRFERLFDQAGLLLVEEEYDDKATLLSKTVYTYKEKSLVKEDYQNPQGQSQRWIDYAYNTTGQVSTMSYYSRRGQLLEIRNQEWIAISVPVKK